MVAIDRSPPLVANPKAVTSKQTCQKVFNQFQNINVPNEECLWSLAVWSDRYCFVWEDIALRPARWSCWPSIWMPLMWPPLHLSMPTVCSNCKSSLFVVQMVVQVLFSKQFNSLIQFMSLLGFYFNVWGWSSLWCDRTLNVRLLYRCNSKRLPSSNCCGRPSRCQNSKPN